MVQFPANRTVVPLDSPSQQPDMLTFRSIDVETANADRASICQIGVVHVRDGRIRERWQTLVNPQDWFDPWNVSIHGIDEEAVTNSPTLTEVWAELASRLQGSVVVSHTSFDRVALERARVLYSLAQLHATWLDSAKIVRRAWPATFGRSGYSLRNVASELGIGFRHHDALEDARAAAEIVIQICADTDTDIEDWLRRVELPIFPRASGSVSERREGKVEGPLFGETILFTGTLGIVRRHAADMAAEAGCDVARSLTKRVTILVVGTQDRRRLRGYDKSTKHRDAEAAISTGREIQILSEQDFLELMGR